MSLTFCSFSSGSSGNSYLIKTEGAALLLDAGATGKNIKEGLARAGATYDDIRVILITHEHYDHIRSLPAIKRALPAAKIFLTEETRDIVMEKFKDRISPEEYHTIKPGEELSVDNLIIKPYSLSHDAICPVGFSVSSGEKKVSVVTDTGIISEEILTAISDSDLIVMEANYEENVLLMGKYPYELKKRIIGARGHLSNEDAAIALSLVLEKNKAKNKPHVLLAHLSKENNTPDMAFITVKNILASRGFTLDIDYTMDVLLRDTVGNPISVGDSMMSSRR